MTLAELIKNAIETLRQSGADNPRLDAHILTAFALGLERAAIAAQTERPVTAAETQAIMALMTRREKGEPVGRILGKREFWGLSFGLNEATLEPRADTETVIEAVLGIRDSGFGIREDFPRIRNLESRILDLGTGTGCLLLALLHEMPRASGIGIDISARAVAQAALNAKTLGLEGRAAFRVGNWAEGIEETFDIAVSNPPYIPSKDIPGLMKEVRDFDPPLALDGGADGLDPYRIALPQLFGILKPGGIAAIEIGIGQARAVTDLFSKHGFIDVAVWKDLSDIDRCVIAGKPLS